MKEGDGGVLIWVVAAGEEGGRAFWGQEMDENKKEENRGKERGI
jgi:hypothetical protein